MAATKPTVDKRRMILDAAVRVFARQGFHTCRVSDIADEAGVAYGLVYHYFGSKDEVLDTLFLERWGVMVEAIAEIDPALAEDPLIFPPPEVLENLHEFSAEAIENPEFQEQWQAVIGV